MEKRPRLFLRWPGLFETLTCGSQQMSLSNPGIPEKEERTKHAHTHTRQISPQIFPHSQIEVCENWQTQTKVIHIALAEQTGKREEAAAFIPALGHVASDHSTRRTMLRTSPLFHKNPPTSTSAGARSHVPMKRNKRNEPNHELPN